MNEHNLIPFPSRGRLAGQPVKAASPPPVIEPGLARYGVAGLPVLPVLGRELQDRVHGGPQRDAALELQLRRRLDHDPDLTAERFALEVNRLRFGLNNLRGLLLARVPESDPSAAGFVMNRQELIDQIDYLIHHADSADFGRF